MIPAIVKAELLFGVEKSRRKKENKILCDTFCSAFQIADFDDAAAVQYAKICSHLEKNGVVIGPNDLLIAAIVISRKGILVTHNVREFSRVPGLHLEDWAEKQ